MSHELTRTNAIRFSFFICLKQDLFEMTHHTHLPSSPSRRRCLTLGGTAAATATAQALGLSVTSLLVPAPAQAAADDYKALVCLFMYGGNDGLNTFTPIDATRHAQYAKVRGRLALPRSSLIGLNADYGMHPSLSALSGAWSEGALAPVFNVGPLAAPLNKAQLRALPKGDTRIPANLFSHPDQQLMWESASTDPFVRTGWGGRASEVLGSNNPVISFGGNANFGLSDSSAPWVLPSAGSEFGPNGYGPWQPVMARRAALESIIRETQKTPLSEAYAQVQRNAFALEKRFQGLFEKPNTKTDTSGMRSAFSALIESNGSFKGNLAEQLYQVARFVNARTQVQGTRQIFFVQFRGFDNHANQVGGSATTGEHSRLLKEVGDSVAAFWGAIKSIGMAQKVTLFTQSDFGRTFVPNESGGTDHAWGNNHMVLGGAVAGRTTYGRYPELAVGGPDDIGQDAWELQGRWIPTASVDQYAATLLRWWGMSEAQLNQALPHLGNFGSVRNLGFMRG
jgi:uncharacterized protein (DUF1501 family)